MKNTINPYPVKMNYALQDETVEAIQKVPAGTVSNDSAWLGIMNGEPLLIAMDGLLRYAKAYAKQYEGKLAEDGVMGDYWLQAIKGLHGLLNGDGAVALERGITTDSKDNGVIEDIYWAALNAAGFKEGVNF